MSSKPTGGTYATTNPDGSVDGPFPFDHLDLSHINKQTQPMTTKERNTRRDEMAHEYAKILMGDGFRLDPSCELPSAASSAQMVVDYAKGVAVEAYLLADSMIKQGEMFSECDVCNDNYVKGMDRVLLARIMSGSATQKELQDVWDANSHLD